MKSLCLTLFLFCQTTFNTFDFEYSNKKEFVQGITDCTLLSNTFVPPTERAVILISVAQAVLESNWGNSRFALEGNNFYGIIETDPTLGVEDRPVTPITSSGDKDPCVDVID